MYACIQRYLCDITPTKAPSTRRQDELYARTLLRPRHIRGADGRPVVRPLIDPAQPIAEFGPPEVDAIHRALRDTPVLANRIVSFLSQVCDFAERRGLRTPNSNPTRAIRRHPERPRTMFLPAADRASFLEASWDCARGRELTPQAACTCVLMLLAGLRLHEATDLRWCEVDLEAGLTSPSSAWVYIHLSAPVLRRHRARIAGAAKGGAS